MSKLYFLANAEIAFPPLFFLRSISNPSVLISDAEKSTKWLCFLCKTMYLY